MERVVVFSSSSIIFSIKNVYFNQKQNLKNYFTKPLMFYYLGPTIIVIETKTVLVNRDFVND